MKKNLVVNLFTNDRIKTTLERAKEIRGDVDRVITWAKRGDVHSRRLAIAKLGNKDLVAEIFSKVAQGMFEGRPGGYSRILRLGTRRGDSATIVIMELVQEPVQKKASKDKDVAEKPEPRRPFGRRGAAKTKGDKGKDEAVAEEAEEAEAVDAENAAVADAVEEADEKAIEPDEAEEEDVEAVDAVDADAEADADEAEEVAEAAEAADAEGADAAEEAVDAAVEPAAADEPDAEPDAAKEND
jgi:large subunit ribosomal protein L17